MYQLHREIISLNHLFQAVPRTALSQPGLMAYQGDIQIWSLVMYLSTARKGLIPRPEQKKALPFKLLMESGLMAFHILTHLHNEDKIPHFQSNSSGQTWATG